MGRVASVSALSLPSMGSWTLPEALSRPMRTNSKAAPSERGLVAPANDSVPSSMQPVMG